MVKKFPSFLFATRMFYSIGNAFFSHLKKTFMKVIGIILIVGGILILVFRGFSQERNWKILAHWKSIKTKKSPWRGRCMPEDLALIAGVILIATDKKKS